MFVCFVHWRADRQRHTQAERHDETNSRFPQLFSEIALKYQADYPTFPLRSEMCSSQMQAWVRSAAQILTIVFVN
jgi:hypothetical protein